MKRVAASRSHELAARQPWAIAAGGREPAQGLPASLRGLASGGGVCVGASDAGSSTRSLHDDGPRPFRCRKCGHPAVDNAADLCAACKWKHPSPFDALHSSGLLQGSPTPTVVGQGAEDVRDHPVRQAALPSVVPGGTLAADMSMETMIQEAWRFQQHRQVRAYLKLANRLPLHVCRERCLLVVSWCWIVCVIPPTLPVRNHCLPAPWQEQHRHRHSRHKHAQHHHKTQDKHHVTFADSWAHADARGSEARPPQDLGSSTLPVMRTGVFKKRGQWNPAFQVELLV